MTITNYFLDAKQMGDEVKVWAQMFFDDGSVTPGKYLPRTVLMKKEYIEEVVMEFLESTLRTEGVIFIWGAGEIFAKKAKLLKGTQTLRLTNIKDRS